MSHTPGKLALEEVSSDSGHIKHLCPVDSEGMSLLTVVEHEGVKFAAVYSDEDARRLVACWNACEGLPTEVLEHAASTGDSLGGHIKLTAQRDELLAALKLATEGLRIWAPADTHITQFDVLIAKAEGTTP
jgi:hypothetical protein